MKGKNFSTNNASGKRKESDYYTTPFSLTRRFLDKWNIEKSFLILEPCCGQANDIVKVLQEKGFTNITSHDLNIDGIDFLYIDGDHTIEGIILDLHYWVPKVVVGGIISGDDFKDRNNSGIKDYWGNQMQYGVEKGVRHFCDRYGYKLNVTGDRVPNFWFVKTH